MAAMKKKNRLLGSLLAQGKAMLNKTGVRQWLLASLVFLALGIMLVASQAPEYDYRIGDQAEEDIRAPGPAINRYRTELLREEAAREAEKRAEADESFYTIDPRIVGEAQDRVERVFVEILNAVNAEAEEPPSVMREEELRSLAETVRQRLLLHDLDISLVSIEEALLLDPVRIAELRDFTGAFVGRFMSENRIRVDDRFAAKEEAVRQIEAEGLPPAEVRIVSEAVRNVILPNLRLDEERVEQARQEARASVPEQVFNEPFIVREGEAITQEHLMLLEEYGLLRREVGYWSILGILLAVALLLGLLGVYLYQYARELLDDERLLPLLALLILVVAGLAQIASLIPAEIFVGTGYLIPVALATMLIAILLDSQLALMSAVILALIVGLVSGGQAGKTMIVALVSGIAGVFSVSRVSQRGDLTRAGLVVGGTAAATMIAFGLALDDRTMITYSFLGLINGIVSAIGAIGLLPYLESVFKVTSAIRLLELSNPNQPLLRRLLMEAPGTYHHSMIVGNLAEAAAEATGGDSLLVRVGSQYHDVGKIKRPYFFVENQFSGENPHEKYSPSLSTLIITAHVKDGVEIAREYGLPEVIIDFIRTHHGTDLVRYFYNKALEAGEADEDAYRYPGPKPQTKETAIVMLADAVEAAVRAMKHHTPGRIESLVRKIIKDRLNEGQLDESDITLKDLDKIADAFVKVLTGIYHHRIEYPEKVLKEMEGKRSEQGRASDGSGGA